MHRVLHGLVGVSSAVVSRDVVFVLSDPSLLWHRRVEASVAKNFVEEDPGGNGHAELLCCIEANPYGALECGCDRTWRHETLR